MVYCSPEGAWAEILPASSMTCVDDQLRKWEWALRSRIYSWENIKDDSCFEPRFNIGWQLRISDYGVDIPIRFGENRGSYVWDAPIKDLGMDLDKLRHRSYAVDREATSRSLELADRIFGDLLPVRNRGFFFWTVGLTWEAIKLVGLEKFMLAMYDEPENIHRLMAWLRDDHLALLDDLERDGLLTLNNEDDDVGSGGLGYSDELRGPGPGKELPARIHDLWGLAEAQETVGISPAMFEEFVLPYQMPLLEKFGLACYGCCEPLHDRIDAILKIPNLRRVSVSPWCDQTKMIERLGRHYIFSRKSNPVRVCAMFDEEGIRAELAETLRIAGEGILEIILKDTHTLQDQPWRIGRWVGIAREEIRKYSGE